MSAAIPQLGGQEPLDDFDQAEQDAKMQLQQQGVRYPIQRVLGRGHYGTVYVVKDNTDGKEYVMKDIVLQGLDDNEVKSALQEARLLQLLHHPYIVAYKESIALPHRLHVVMELCTEGDLAQAIRRRNKALQEALRTLKKNNLILPTDKHAMEMYANLVASRSMDSDDDDDDDDDGPEDELKDPAAIAAKNASMPSCLQVPKPPLGGYASIDSALRHILWPEEQVLEWFAQLALALHRLHQSRILHRDLKTQNVFLTQMPLYDQPTDPNQATLPPCIGTIVVAKIGDLGISKVVQSETALAQTVVGTPYYLSPELCEGRNYGTKSDIWSLGCVLYEVLTLRHAFDGKTLPALVMKILSGVYPPLPTLYSAPLRELVASMLQQDPDRRPSTRAIIEHPLLKPWVLRALAQASVLYNAQLQERREKTVPEGAAASEPHPFTKSVLNPFTVQEGAETDRNSAGSTTLKTTSAPNFDGLKSIRVTMSAAGIVNVTDQPDPALLASLERANKSQGGSKPEGASNALDVLISKALWDDVWKDLDESTVDVPDEIEEVFEGINPGPDKQPLSFKPGRRNSNCDPIEEETQQDLEASSARVLGTNKTPSARSSGESAFSSAFASAMKGVAQASSKPPVSATNTSSSSAGVRGSFPQVSSGPKGGMASSASSRAPTSSASGSVPRPRLGSGGSSAISSVPVARAAKPPSSSGQGKGPAAGKGTNPINLFPSTNASPKVAASGATTLKNNMKTLQRHWHEDHEGLFESLLKESEQMRLRAVSKSPRKGESPERKAGESPDREDSGTSDLDASHLSSRVGDIDAAVASAFAGLSELDDDDEDTDVIGSVAASQGGAIQQTPKRGAFIVPPPPPSVQCPSTTPRSISPAANRIGNVNRARGHARAGSAMQMSPRVPVRAGDIAGRPHHRPSGSVGGTPKSHLKHPGSAFTPVLPPQEDYDESDDEAIKRKILAANAGAAGVGRGSDIAQRQREFKRQHALERAAKKAEEQERIREFKRRIKNAQGRFHRDGTTPNEPASATPAAAASPAQGASNPPSGHFLRRGQGAVNRGTEKDKSDDSEAERARAEAAEKRRREREAFLKMIQEQKRSHARSSSLDAFEIAVPSKPPQPQASSESKMSTNAETSGKKDVGAGGEASTPSSADSKPPRSGLRERIAAAKAEAKVGRKNSLEIELVISPEQERKLAERAAANAAASTATPSSANTPSQFAHGRALQGGDVPSLLEDSPEKASGEHDPSRRDSIHEALPLLLGRRSSLSPTHTARSPPRTQTMSSAQSALAEARRQSLGSPIAKGEQGGSTSQQPSQANPASTVEETQADEDPELALLRHQRELEETIVSLRKYCKTQLGETLFRKVYFYVRALQNAEEGSEAEREEAKINELLAGNPQQKVCLLLINKLVRCEDRYFTEFRVNEDRE